MKNEPKISYKALTFLGMLLVTFGLSSCVLAYKVITIYGTIYSAAALIVPFRYVLSDIIAEVYGFYIAKKFIWLMIICGFIFAIIVNSIIYLPSPSYWNHQPEYNFVLGNTLRIVINASLGFIIGSFLNVYLLSKWKLFTKGKYFWMRSIGSSIVGELTQYSIGLATLYYGIFNWQKIFQLIMLDYSIQVIIILLVTPVAQVAVHILKKYEQIDVYTQDIKFNPFVLSEK